MTDLNLAAIRERAERYTQTGSALDGRYSAKDVPDLLAEVERLTAERDEWRRAAEAEASRRSPDVADALAARARQAEAERDRALCEVDGVRQELARMAGNLDDARATLALRDGELVSANSQRDHARAERARLAATVHRMWALARNWRNMDPAASLDFGDAVAEVEDALIAPHGPGVDSGTSKPDSAAHGDAGPADGAVATEPGERCGFEWDGFGDEAHLCRLAPGHDSDMHECQCGTVNLTDTAPNQPRTWALPDEPGPDVTALWDPRGWHWDREGSRWRRRTPSGMGGVTLSWHALVADTTSLTDASEATP